MGILIFFNNDSYNLGRKQRHTHTSARSFMSTLRQDSIELNSLQFKVCFVCLGVTDAKLGRSGILNTESTSQIKVEALDHNLPTNYIRMKFVCKGDDYRSSSSSCSTSSTQSK